MFYFPSFTFICDFPKRHCQPVVEVMQYHFGNNNLGDTLKRKKSEGFLVPVETLNSGPL